MKLTIERTAFAKEFSQAAAVAPSRSPKPVLTHVLLDASGDGVFLTGTDTEISVRVKVTSATVTKPGKCLLPVTMTNAVLNESSDDQLTIELTSNGTFIKASRNKHKLSAADADLFPSRKPDEPVWSVTLPSATLRTMLKRTAFACDDKATRFTFNGVLLELDGGILYAVGCDGGRLATVHSGDVSIANDPGEQMRAILPLKAATTIQRVFGDAGDVRVSFDANSLQVASDGVEFHARLLEGRYPQWREMIDSRAKEGVNSVAVPCGTLNQAIRQASITTSVESRGIDFTFSNGQMRLVGSGAEVGESSVEIPVPYDGDELTIRLNGQFVSDFVKVLPSETVLSLSLIDSNNSVFITTEDDYRYNIMPLATGA